MSQKLSPALLTTYINSFDGQVNLSDLHQTGSHVFLGVGYLRYKCPCGGKNHFATRAMNYDTGKSITASPILHCREHNHKWMIINNVAQVIEYEEAKFRDLLDKHSDKVGKTFMAQEAFKLWSEQGVPLEMLEVNDDELTKLHHLRMSHIVNSIAKHGGLPKGKAYYIEPAGDGTKNLTAFPL